MKFTNEQIEWTRALYGTCIGSEECSAWVANEAKVKYGLSLEDAETLTGLAFNKWVEAYTK